MRAVTQLPQGYEKLGEVQLAKNQGLLIGLNLAALPLLVGWAWLFGYAVHVLVPGFTLPTEYTIDLRGLAGLVGMFVGIMVGVILVHEAIHGVFFWVFSGQRPVFGITWKYAYASAPGWYFPRGQYLIIGLAPLVLISLAGVLILPVIPYAAIPGLLIALTLNATGAIGDLYIVGNLLFVPRHTLILDQKDQITWYSPVLARKTGDIVVGEISNE
jgi:hypothetical protein